ncbi:hypothetical protein FDP41_002894 [Naegleria fowleri]|uniref:EF-hand domain-containing protein n=1 Tax=Naegleria fowleri TaxID=5763 RepID=A0A6A5BZH5_NAEFO|nr:uncharacterized protein FDP41_002894 [Naegleria fowleri]KAF0978379.1 hypothetical protein FDP41_002894 [Naegleria fowleri]CAG4719464.1 unnamed protein product [Naegleria fowleri]
MKNRSFAPEQVQQFIGAFSQFDTEGDGSIDVRQVGHLMFLIGLTPSEEEVTNIMNEIEQANGDLIQRKRIEEAQMNEEEMEEPTIRMGFIDFLNKLEDFKNIHPEQFVAIESNMSDELQ